MRVKPVLKSLIVAYAITALLLLLLAFLLFRLELDEKAVGAGITVIYVLSCFLGGFFMGKSKKQQKYLWGTFLGGAYFLLLVMISWISKRAVFLPEVKELATLLLCLSSGTLGGMLS